MSLGRALGGPVEGFQIVCKSTRRISNPKSLDGLGEGVEMVSKMSVGMHNSYWSDRELILSPGLLGESQIQNLQGVLRSNRGTLRTVL